MKNVSNILLASLAVMLSLGTVSAKHGSEPRCIGNVTTVKIVSFNEITQTPKAKGFFSYIHIGGGAVIYETKAGVAGSYRPGQSQLITHTEISFKLENPNGPPATLCRQGKSQ